MQIKHTAICKNANCIAFLICCKNDYIEYELLFLLHIQCYNNTKVTSLIRYSRYFINIKIFYIKTVMDYYVSVTIFLIIYYYFQICTENPVFSLFLLFSVQNPPYSLTYDYSTFLTMKLCLWEQDPWLKCLLITK